MRRSGALYNACRTIFPSSLLYSDLLCHSFSAPLAIRWKGESPTSQQGRDVPSLDYEHEEDILARLRARYDLEPAAALAAIDSPWPHGPKIRRRTDRRQRSSHLPDSNNNSSEPPLPPPAVWQPTLRDLEQRLCFLTDTVGYAPDVAVRLLSKAPDRHRVIASDIGTSNSTKGIVGREAGHPDEPPGRALAFTTSEEKPQEDAAAWAKTADFESLRAGYVAWTNADPEARVHSNGNRPSTSSAGVLDGVGTRPADDPTKTGDEEYPSTSTSKSVVDLAALARRVPRSVFRWQGEWSHRKRRNARKDRKSVV